MTHLEILKLIETVSPDDAAKLDEIDERVWCYLNECDTQKLKLGDAYRIYTTDSKFWPLGYKVVVFNGVKYTRSRDALKSIRPEGYRLRSMNYKDGWTTTLSKEEVFGSHSTGKFDFETEELAELHATIQAIAYEREKQ